MSLHPKSIFCPGCGSLNVKTAPVPHLKTASESEEDESARSYKLTIWVMASLALFIQALLVFDYLILL